jgi:hypothetical protein
VAEGGAELEAERHEPSGGRARQGTGLGGAGKAPSRGVRGSLREMQPDAMGGAELELDVTPLVLLALKLEHNIMCIGISYCLLHLECIH